MLRKLHPLSLIYIAGLICCFLPSASKAQEQEQTSIYITLGAVLSETGALAPVALHVRRGYDIAVKAINERGGIDIEGAKYKFRIKYKDSGSDPKKAALLAEELITKDNVKYMLGPYGSTMAAAVAPVVNRLKRPLIQNQGAARKLFRKDWPYVFGILSSADQYLGSAVNVLGQILTARGLNPKEQKIAVLYRTDLGSRDIRAGVIEEAKRWGMQVAIDDIFPEKEEEIKEKFKKIEKENIIALFVTGRGFAVEKTVEQLSDNKIYIPMVAATHCDAAKATEMGGKADHLLCATQWDPYINIPDQTFGSSVNYATDYYLEYQYHPPYQAAQSSGAIMTYAHAFKQANSLDPEKVRLALENLNITTLFGEVKFDEQHRNIAKPMFLYQVEGDKYRIVAPKRFAWKKLVYPKPPSQAEQGIKEKRASTEATPAA